MLKCENGKISIEWSVLQGDNTFLRELEALMVGVYLKEKNMRLESAIASLVNEGKLSVNSDEYGAVVQEESDKIGTELATTLRVLVNSAVSSAENYVNSGQSEIHLISDKTLRERVASALRKSDEKFAKSLCDEIETPARKTKTRKKATESKKAKIEQRTDQISSDFKNNFGLPYERITVAELTEYYKECYGEILTANLTKVQIASRFNEKVAETGVICDFTKPLSNLKI